jgi:hypothetical protein
MKNNKRERDIDTLEEKFLSVVNISYSRVRKRRIRPTSSPKVSQLQTKEREESEEREELDLHCDENIEDIYKKNVPLLPPMCHCIECFAYMGEMNPRQYCCKTYCPYSNFEPNELLALQVYYLRTSPYYNDPKFIYYSEYHDVIQNFITTNGVLVSVTNGISDSDDQTQNADLDFINQ